MVYSVVSNFLRKIVCEIAERDRIRTDRTVSCEYNGLPPILLRYCRNVTQFAIADLKIKRLRKYRILVF